MPDVNLTLRYLREAVNKAILQQPVSIEIHRTQRVSDGASGHIVSETILPPFTGRLRPSSRSVQTRQTTAGTTQTAGWTLLAPMNADIQQSAEITDTFTLADGRNFRVIQVKRVSYAGQVVGIEAECVELQ